MFDKLKKHHIGVIVDNDTIPIIEKKYKKKFHLDKIQGTRVMFVQDEELGIYKEFIGKEGRAKNISVGFYHFCYSLNNAQDLKEFENFIEQNRLGHSITKLEKSGSKECGWIKFFYIKNHGFIEINLIDK